MIIQCTNCQKQYSIDAGKLNQKTVKFRCKACNQMVTVTVPQAKAPDPVRADHAPKAPSQTVTSSGPAASGTAAASHAAPPNEPSPQRVEAPGKKDHKPAGKKRLGVGGKMLLLFFLVPILLMVIASGLYIWQLKDLTNNISHDSHQIVERLSQDLVNDTARMVSEQCRLYLLVHPELTREKLNLDQEFRKLSMQKVGETGYTCIYSVPDESGASAVWVHPNDKIVGVDLPPAMHKALGSNYIAWYNIYKGAYKGKPSSGYYLWKEKDGSERDKYMTCVPVQGTPYIVAATTYVDEINHDVRNLKTTADRMTHRAASIIFGVFAGTLGLMGSSVLFYGRRLKGNLIKLTDAAERISVGELNTDIDIQSNDEISDLADTIGRMQESIRLSIERLRRRR
jgi:predicted Zn finger-like uncharacterized protein